MKKPKLIVFSSRGKSSFSILQRKILGRIAQVTYVKALNPLPTRKLLGRILSADYIGLTPRVGGGLAHLVKRLPNLKGVVLPTTGTEWLDVMAFQRRGIKVAHVPDFCGDSAAEFTIGLLLALVRRIPDERLLRGKARGKSRPAMELKGKTIGIIGLGRIGLRVARLARAFGMKVLAVDEKRKGKDVDLKTLLKNSDIVSLHLPLNASTTHFLNASRFNRMKRGVFLINTSRPHLVETKAVLSALRTRRLAGYAVDIGYCSKAETAGLVSHPDVLAVPHISWYTKEAVRSEVEEWVSEMTAMVRGRPRSLVPNQE